MGGPVLPYGRSPRPWNTARLARIALIIAVAVGCVTVAFWMMARAMEPEVGLNVPPSQMPIGGLPADVSSISYRLGGALDPVPQRYQFRTAEGSFRTWAEQMGFELSVRSSVVNDLTAGEIVIELSLTGRQMTGPDSGSHVSYDPSTGMAYYYSHTR